MKKLEIGKKYAATKEFIETLKTDFKGCDKIEVSELTLKYVDEQEQLAKFKGDIIITMSNDTFFVDGENLDKYIKEL